MEKDFEIEILDKNINDANSTQLPVNFLTFGDIENDDVKVYIKQNVYNALEKFAASNTSKELGSILLGEYFQEYGKTHIIISQYIEAKYTDASASTLTFTHKTWDYVHSEHEHKYFDKKIIGWQHTHPNYGIFLSNYDMFIQENFFNLPFQIAYVIDPIQNLRGFFQWKNGRIEKLKGYYIYDDIGKPIKIEQTKKQKVESVPPKTSKLTNAIITLLCVVIIFLSYSMVSLNSKYNNQLSKQTEILSELANQNTEIEAQQNAISIQKTKIDEQNEIIQNQSQQIDELKNFIKNSENIDNGVIFKIYTVTPGDNLYKICEMNNLNYNATIKIILAINNIENANQIYVGQTILLPIVNNVD